MEIDVNSYPPGPSRVRTTTIHELALPPLGRSLYYPARALASGKSRPGDLVTVSSRLDKRVKVMSNMGVFGWIRESVRRSILLGFSDAVEQLGGAADGNEPLHPQLAAVLRQSTPIAMTHVPTERPASKQERKRLGRSLEQLRQPPAKPADKAS